MFSESINQKVGVPNLHHHTPYVASDKRYDKMVYRRCGKSGLLLPAISLGLWHNFGSVDVFECFEKIAYTAFDNGITHFDLANNYGPVAGSAEENFGRILKRGLGAYRDEMIITTKAGYDMHPGPYGEWGSRKTLMASIDASLKRMNLDYVDIFYSHRPDPNTPFEETMGALVDIVRQGKALYVGISNYDAEQSKEAIRILKEQNVHCLVHQASYSMLNRWTEQGLMSVLEEEGVGMVAFSPLAQGMLTDKYLNGIPQDSRAARATGFLQESAITPEVVAKIRRLNELAKERNQTLAEMALAWLLRKKVVTSVIVGARNSEQLLTNLKALENLEFSEEELAEIEKTI